MPVIKRVMKLALGLLSLESTPVSSKELQAQITRIDSELASLLPKALTMLWKKGLALRSSYKINGRHYFLLFGVEQYHKIAGSNVWFVAYTEEESSNTIQEKIVHLLYEEKTTLTLCEIASRLKENYSETFLKKVQFYLRQLVESGTLGRKGKPYQYYHSLLETSVELDVEKISVPEQILALLQKRKTALASSEISEIINAKTLQAKPAALSLALTRLSTSGRLYKSSIRLGARSEIRGHLFALDSAMIDERLKKMKEVKTKQ